MKSLPATFAIFNSFHATHIQAECVLASFPSRVGPGDEAKCVYKHIVPSIKPYI